MSDVFISYTRDDRAHADQIKRRLEALGLDVFLDVDGGVESGSSFPQRIADEIAATKSVVAIWTPYALTRDWCRRECFLARQLGKLLPIAVAPLTPGDLREFVDASYESLEDFEGQEKHFGWSQVLGSIARALDRWAELNPDHADAMNTLDRAAQVRRASIACRPIAQAALNSGLTGATAIWARTKDSVDAEELQRFADSFIGTAEGLAARTRVAQLNERGRIEGDAQSARSFESMWGDKESLTSARLAGEYAQKTIEASHRFDSKWPRTEWTQQLADLRKEMAAIDDRSRQHLAEIAEQAAVASVQRDAQRAAEHRALQADYAASEKAVAAGQATMLGCAALVVLTVIIVAWQTIR